MATMPIASAIQARISGCLSTQPRQPGRGGAAGAAAGPEAGVAEPTARPAGGTREPTPVLAGPTGWKRVKPCIHRKALGGSATKAKAASGETAIVAERSTRGIGHAHQQDGSTRGVDQPVGD